MAKPYRFGFVLEHALGHITHGMYLKQAADADPTVEYEAMRIVPEIADAWKWKLRLNWNLIGSVAARKRILAAQYGGKLDLVFIHTQVMGFFTRSLARRIPLVLSMDATPINLDGFGTYFGHFYDDSAFMAWFKKTGNRIMYSGAQKIVTLNKWAAASLVRDYQVSPEKIVTIPPAVNVNLWKHPRVFSRRGTPGNGPAKILFVGGDFKRKGGLVLLKAFAQLPPGLCTLDIVSELDKTTPVPPGVTLHGKLANNSPELIRLYAEADFFVLPTWADLNCLVIMEALAMRIPVITTDMAGLPEQVIPGHTGLLMQAGDADALTQHMITLGRDPDLRARMGVNGRSHVEQNFNAEINYPRLLRLLKETVDTFRARRAARLPQPQPEMTSAAGPEPKDVVGIPQPVAMTR